MARRTICAFCGAGLALTEVDLYRDIVCLEFGGELKLVTYHQSYTLDSVRNVGLGRVPIAIRYHAAVLCHVERNFRRDEQQKNIVFGGNTRLHGDQLCWSKIKCHRSQLRSWNDREHGCVWTNLDLQFRNPSILRRL